MRKCHDNIRACDGQDISETYKDDIRRRKPEWLRTPNAAFGGLKPLEVIERGETDRLWRMLFYLESGVAT